MAKIKAETANLIAGEIIERLRPFCHKVHVVGSLCRGKPKVGDIDLLVIPRYKGSVNLLDRAINKLIAGGFLALRWPKLYTRLYRPRDRLLLHRPSGINIDIVSTSSNCWFVSLVVHTSGKRTRKQIAGEAQRKGWRFSIHGNGFDTPNGHIQCQSEREVFELLGLPYLRPEQRE